MLWTTYPRAVRTGMRPRAYPVNGQLKPRRIVQSIAMIKGQYSCVRSEEGPARGVVCYQGTRD